MGGEAAKERRRLKRLAAAAAQKNDAAESAPSVVKKVGAKEGGQGNIAQLRLQRKIARKAKGTFKPLEGQAPPQIRKRKVDESSNRSPLKKFKGSKNHSSSKKNNNNSATTGKAQATKKTKAKKPKHLKRKMEQLTKAMSSGGSGEGEESTVEQLEQQMQELAKQMEEFKKIKSQKSKNKPTANVKVASDEDTDIVQSKGPDEDSISNAQRVHSEDENEIKRTPSQMDEDSSSDDDEDDIVEQVNTRSRGKRRRGRRENNNDKDGDEPEENKVAKDATSEAAEKDQSDQNLSAVESTKVSAEEMQSSTAPPVTDDEAKQLKKTPKKDDKRRCIGRKPVTDFEVNKCYNGKVQYIKPRLGAFIDIGCHSDAFIHISCISDSYITSVEEVLKVGDEVENARVVEIDREKKRITLSLRSEEHDAVKSQKGKVATDAAEDAVEQKEEKTPVSKPKETLPVVNSFSNNQVAENKAVPVSSAQKTGAQKTGADLKRERKLARRAARRAMQNNDA